MARQYLFLVMGTIEIATKLHNEPMNINTRSASCTHCAFSVLIVANPQIATDVLGDLFRLSYWFSYI